MNLLAMDTSTHRAAVALRRDDGATFVAEVDAGTRHGRSLVPALRDLLDRAAVAPDELGGIAVGLGPGSFTGLRVGVTAAKTLAYALGRPLVGLETLDVIARNAPADAMAVAAVADAQRGDLFAAEYARDGTGALVRTGPVRIVPAGPWLEALATGTLVLGPGLEAVRFPLPERLPTAPEAWHLPDPLRLLEAAREAFEEGRRDDPWFLEPRYLRRSAAEEKADPVPEPS